MVLSSWFPFCCCCSSSVCLSVRKQQASHTSTGNAAADVRAITVDRHHPHPIPIPNQQGGGPSCHGHGSKVNNTSSNNAFNISSAIIIDAANALAFAASSPHPPRVDGVLQRQNADDDIGAAAALLLAAGSIGKGRASLPKSPVVVIHGTFPAQEQTLPNPVQGMTSISPGNHQTNTVSCNHAGASASSTGANPASLQHGVNLCTFPLVSGGAQEFLVEEAGGNVKMSAAGFEAAMLRYGELLRSG
jgi:hypothetical protein